LNPVGYLVGFALAFLVFLLARWVGFDRDRAFYPTVLMVVASYYVLFAAMAGSGQAIATESVLMVGFVLLAVAGFKRSLWLVVAGLAGHGVFDFVHGQMVTNPGVPEWWPAFCATYDVAAAAFLAWLLTRPGSLPARVR